MNRGVPLRSPKPFNIALGFLALFFVLSTCPASRAQCDEVRNGDAMWVRLLQPVSSYSARRGDSVRAMIIESPQCDGRDLLPIGTELEGTIRKVKRVGLGLVHETASIELNFERLDLDDNAPIEIATRITEIDNAREIVKDGIIHGVRATDTPQGRITSRLAHLPTWNPYSDLGLIAYRTAFPVFPEPEISLPVGTDVHIVFVTSAKLPFLLRDDQSSLNFSPQDDASVATSLPLIPTRTSTLGGKDADIVNVVLLGTRQQIDAAFASAGWMNGARTSTRSVAREFHAFLAFKNDPDAPISKQLLEGKYPDVTWERGLDSYAKREHLRVWRLDGATPAETVWVGAFTRETGATLSVRYRHFIHHIDPDLDAGRDMMIRGLILAGCVEALNIEQDSTRALSTLNATGDWMKTDGSLAIVKLKDCSNPVFRYDLAAQQPEKPVRPKSKFVRYLRMQILSYRSDVVRGNIVYGAFDLTRMMIRSRHHGDRSAFSAAQSSSGTGDSRDRGYSIAASATAGISR
jgi:hypothetical protein